MLVHGFGASANLNWRLLAGHLARHGFDTFALDYGDAGRGRLTALGPARRSFGYGDAASCGHELAAFVDRVRAATGATKVDLVGHSYGALICQYYLKRLDGNERVERMVGIAPTFHGTTFNGLLAYPRIVSLASAALGASLIDQAVGSAFLAELYADGDLAPGVDYTTISPRWDHISTPITAQRLDGPGVRNIRLRRGVSDHISIAASRHARAEVIAALGRPHSFSTAH
ncbi:esterase/lipase family protein [Nocardia neocaledoniensis]|uniref:esterase/lipase family protein n=1 Tax=Nocardia neocaledoniensis TaxID=236511 RepID=UPI00142E3BC9|nr:alpha/beta fold hydrolase [Nocardia neocaledoniensis]